MCFRRHRPSRGRVCLKLFGEQVARFRRVRNRRLVRRPVLFDVYVNPLVGLWRRALGDGELRDAFLFARHGRFGRFRCQVQRLRRRRGLLHRRLDERRQLCGGRGVHRRLSQRRLSHAALCDCFGRLNCGCCLWRGRCFCF